MANNYPHGGKKTEKILYTTIASRREGIKIIRNPKRCRRCIGESATGNVVNHIPATSRR